MAIQRNFQCGGPRLEHGGGNGGGGVAPQAQLCVGADGQHRPVHLFLIPRVQAPQGGRDDFIHIPNGVHHALAVKARAAVKGKADFVGAHGNARGTHAAPHGAVFGSYNRFHAGQAAIGVYLMRFDGSNSRSTHSSSSPM